MTSWIGRSRQAARNRRTTRRRISLSRRSVTLAAGSLAGIVDRAAAQAADAPGLSLQILADPPVDPCPLG